MNMYAAAPSPGPAGADDGTHEPQGLALVDEHIAQVISGTQNELNSFTPKKFETDAFIGDLSFGGADRASNLANHHKWAQRVMSETLGGVGADLEHFVAGCHDARTFLTDADDTASVDLDNRRQAVEALATGTKSDCGDRAYKDSGGVPILETGF